MLKIWIFRNGKPGRKREEIMRESGILLPVFCLPSPNGIGCFSKEAYRWVDFLEKAGQKYWQILPLGPTSFGDSPYQSFSTYAGNPYFIDLEQLAAQGLLKRSEVRKCDCGLKEQDIDYGKLYRNRMPLLKKAYGRSLEKEDPEFAQFRKENGAWLDDYCLFMAVKDIFDRLKKEYDVFWTQERRSAAQAQGLTPYEVSVMASIVSGETLKESEYPVIAGVYLNRLHKGMKLQADPTIAFCYDYTLDRILKKHLKVDSPYNTYKYKGLPPAPINVPPKACIEAVLHPDEHGYIYFCASPEFNGTHRFAVTYGEHLKNARAFQRALTQRQKEKAAASR